MRIFGHFWGPFSAACLAWNWILLKFLQIVIRTIECWLWGALSTCEICTAKHFRDYSTSLLTLSYFLCLRLRVILSEPWTPTLILFYFLRLQPKFFNIIVPLKLINVIKCPRVFVKWRWFRFVCGKIVLAISTNLHSYFIDQGPKYSKIFYLIRYMYVIQW